MLRGEDLLSSTPRQIALYARARSTLGIGDGDAAVRPPALRHGRGQQEALQARPRGAPARPTATRASCPRGCSTTSRCSAGRSPPTATCSPSTRWSRRSTSSDVNPNPARFDLKKAEAINAAHMRLLSLEDITHRVLPFLKAAGVVGDPVHDADAQLLELAMPLVAERINKLTEAVDMLGFLFVDEDDVHPRRGRRREAARRRRPRGRAGGVRRARGARATWSTAAIEEALQAALVDGLGLKPRNAFGPVRVAVTGRRVSPPLFESLELLGRDRSLARLAGRAGVTRSDRRGRARRGPALPPDPRAAAGPGCVAADRSACSRSSSAMLRRRCRSSVQVPFAVWYALDRPATSSSEPRRGWSTSTTRRPLGLAYLNLALACAIPVTWFAHPRAPRPAAALAGLGAARGSGGAAAGLLRALRRGAGRHAGRLGAAAGAGRAAPR